MIPEEIFYNKELSDNIRDIVINSACTFENAVRLLKISNNHKRDVPIIKELLNNGLGFATAKRVIEGLDVDKQISCIKCKIGLRV